MIGSFITMILGKFVAVVQWFSQLFVAIFAAFWDLVTDSFCWVFEQFLDVAVSAVSSIDVSGLQSLTSYGSLPGDLLNILGLLGVSQAIAIISASIVIRMGLQLIPFVRLGS